MLKLLLLVFKLEDFDIKLGARCLDLNFLVLRGVLLRLGWGCLGFGLVVSATEKLIEE